MNNKTFIKNKKIFTKTIKKKYEEARVIVIKKLTNKFVIIL